MTHAITAIDGDLGNLLSKHFQGNFYPDYVKVDGVVLPEVYGKFSGAIENLEVRDDDVWICTFPKSGSTWTQEMVWCIANDLDFERAKVLLEERFVFLEICTLIDFDAIQRDFPELKISSTNVNSISCIEKLSSPRFIRTHLPFHLLPRQIRTGEKTPKIISVFRNAKDTCISYYHHSVLFEGYSGNFDDFCKLFLGNALCFAPFWGHIISYWEKRSQNNVLILNYTDMKKDLPSIIRKTAKFLGKNLTADQVSLLAEHLSFEKMKGNPAVNREAVVAFRQRLMTNKQNGSFIRNGTTDQWKSVMTTEIVERFDNWSRDNLKNTKLRL